MQMKMLANARAGRLTEIHSDIETVRFIKLLQRSDDALRELHHLGQLFGLRRCNSFKMLIRCHHRMARRVGKQVQDDEVVCAAKYNESLGVAARWAPADSPIEEVPA